MSDNPNGITSELLQGVLRLMAGDQSVSFRIDQSADTAYINMNEMTVYLPELDEQADHDTVIGFSVHEALHCKYTDPDYSGLVKSVMFRARKTGFSSRVTMMVPDAINILEDIRIESRGMQDFRGLPRVFRKLYKQVWSKEIWEGIQDFKPQDLWNQVNFSWKMAQWNPEAKQNFDPADNPQVQDLIDQAKACNSTYQIANLVLDNLEEPEPVQVAAEQVLEDFQEPTSGCQSEEEETIQGSSEEPVEEEVDKQSEENPDIIESNTKEDNHGSDVEKFLNEEERQEWREWKEEGIQDFDKAINEEIAKEGPAEDTGVITKKDPAFYEMAGYWKTDWLEINSLNPVSEDPDKRGWFATRRPDIQSRDGRDRVKEFIDAIKQKSGKGGNNVTSAVKAAQKLYRALERKKKAAEDARTRTWDSGDLDVTKMHLARVSDDIFLSHQTEYSGSDYGVVFMLDCSGSMISGAGKRCLHKLGVLTAFCKMAGIKFRVVPWGSITRHGEYLVDQDTFRTPHLFARFFIGYANELKHSLFISGTEQSSLVAISCSHLNTWTRTTGVPLQNTRLFMMTDGMIQTNFDVQALCSRDDTLLSGYRYRKVFDRYYQTRNGKWLNVPFPVKFMDDIEINRRLDSMVESAAIVRAQFPEVSISCIYEDDQSITPKMIQNIYEIADRSNQIQQVDQPKSWNPTGTDKIKKVPALLSWKMKPGAPVDQVMVSTNAWSDDALESDLFKSIPVKGSTVSAGSVMSEYAESVSDFITERKRS